MKLLSFSDRLWQFAGWLVQGSLGRIPSKVYLRFAMYMALIGTFLTIDAAVNLFGGYTDTLTLVTLRCDTVTFQCLTYAGLAVGTILACGGYALFARESQPHAPSAFPPFTGRRHLIGRRT